MAVHMQLRDAWPGLQDFEPGASEAVPHGDELHHVVALASLIATARHACLIPLRVHYRLAS